MMIVALNVERVVEVADGGDDLFGPFNDRIVFGFDVDVTKVNDQNSHTFAPSQDNR